MKDEKLQHLLSRNNIKWQFNLSRAPWWGGLVKQAFYKTVGKGNVKWNELEEIIIDIETTNSRPLCYVEDDIELPLLTPNVMFGQPNVIPQQDPSAIQDGELRKRAEYLRQCKDALWSRWSSEYLKSEIIKSLRERHNMKHNRREMLLKPRDVVLIKGEERNRGHWKIGIVEKLIQGRDKVVRGTKLRAGKSTLERPVQHLFPWNFHATSCKRSHKHQMKVQSWTQGFQSSVQEGKRPKRREDS